MATTTAEEEFIEQLKQIDDPVASAVADWRIEHIRDWTGDPAVDITIVFEDAKLYDAWPKRGGLRRAVENLARDYFPDRWSFVSFSAETEDLDPERLR